MPVLRADCRLHFEGAISPTEQHHLPLMRGRYCMEVCSETFVSWLFACWLMTVARKWIIDLGTFFSQPTCKFLILLLSSISSRMVLQERKAPDSRCSSVVTKAPGEIQTGSYGERHSSPLCLQSTSSSIDHCQVVESGWTLDADGGQ